MPSQTNFVLTSPPGPPAQEWLELLRQQKILVRWFGYPELKDKLRITIGTPEEARALVAAAQSILGAGKKKAGSH